MAGFNFGSNILTDPKIVGGGQAFTNSMQNMGKFGSAGSNALGNVGKIGDVANKVGKTTKFMDAANKYVAPAQAAMGAVSLGTDIYNSIKAQQQAKEQLDMAKKNFNLELEKQQKYELANNQLAASIDKAWGGSGKVERTLDYSKYATGQGLEKGGAGAGMYMGNNPKQATTESSELNGSGNMPTMGNAISKPVGYSDTLDNGDNEEEAEQN